MTVSVREATEADLEAIRAVAEDAWYAALGGALDPAEIAGALEAYYDPEVVGAGIESEGIAFYVASVGGEVRGFASAERTWADEVELHTVYVHPDRWGEGIGEALFERVETWARGEGADRVACGVLADNVVGIGFFESVGFERGRTTEAEIVGAVYDEYEYEYELRA
ncbi:MAG: N-acetylglutamate synthase-like GNAT family acetyltransferase [Natronomonas sp.]|jgi:N-acetylglutamate synthase-like GNAT family acetyltransferase